MKLRIALPILVSLAVAILLFTPRDIAAAQLDGLHDTCLETELKGCSVLHSGYITPDQGPRLAFQTQAGFTDDDGVKGGVVIFADEPDGWTVIADEFVGYRYDVPILVEHSEQLLHVPAAFGGSGNYNADLLLRWGDPTSAALVTGWQQIDTTSWLRSIDTWLPDGLEIWQGVDFDFDDWFYDRLEARTALWQADDGNCCPTGGWATITFYLSGDAIYVESVAYEPPPKAK